MRASGSLPAVLPPAFTDDGRMLVDGGVIENIPLRSMKTLKAGPNLVVHFGMREEPQRFEVDYTSIPGRWRLSARCSRHPAGGNCRPSPTPSTCCSVAWSCTRAPNCCRSARSTSCLPYRRFPGANFMDFDRHAEVFEAAYQWCRGRIDELDKQGNAALAAILATRN